MVKGLKESSILKILVMLLLSVVFALGAMFMTGCDNGNKGDNDDYKEPDLGPIPESGARVNFNYYREDGKYSAWDMWIWSPSAEGTAHAFAGTKTIGGKKWGTLTVTLDNAKADSDGHVMGFIVRTAGAWTTKDPDLDRFIDSDMLTDRYAKVYLVTGDANIYLNEQEGIAAMEKVGKPSITAARFSDFDRVFIETNTKITKNSKFKVKDAEGNVIVTADCADSTNAKFVGEDFISVNLPSGTNIDFTQTYIAYDEPDSFDPKVNFSSCEVGKFRLYDKTRFNELYGYDGTLGAEYSAERTVFTVWSPYATAMKLNIYAAGEGGVASTYDMEKGEKGTWTYMLNGDQKNKYYTYTVTNGTATSEVVDPYARSGGRDGARGMIVDLASTNPDGWDSQTMPKLASNSKAVIWEAQLRDVTIHESSGVSAANRGKFLGLTETGTTNSKGQTTALDYLKDLGVTEVHFQPLFDFASVKEDFNVATYDKVGEYNWGYDPLNYNMPEGSYSSDPADGSKRVNEMKQMIMALHNAGIQVVMDVVYNHVSNAQSSNFEKLMPGYYFRMTNAGKFYNGSGCGNETASEHYMFRKFMIDSVKYWTEEYKIDGFRFDLMGCHDIVTMNTIYDELEAINPDVIVYGEGWTGGTSGLLSSEAALKANASKMPDIAFFNDNIRDDLKGGVFDDEDGLLSDCGFVSGVKANESIIYKGAQGGGFANPTQSINYTACHDNSLLWDRLNTSVDDTAENIKAMNRMAAVAIFTSQGIGFIPAGEEMLRSKKTEKDNAFDNRPHAYLSDPNYYFADNSYKSPDRTNAINWELLDTNSDMVAFYKALIRIKKTFPQFGLETKEQIAECVSTQTYKLGDNNEIVTDKDGKPVMISRDTGTRDGVAVYAVKDPNSNTYAIVIFNTNGAAKKVAVPNGEYSVFVNGNRANATTALDTFTGSEMTVGARSAVIMTAELSKNVVDAWTYNVADLA